MNKTLSNKQSNTIPEDDKWNGQKLLGSIEYFLHHLNPDIRKITRRLKHFHLKILKKKQSAIFNQTCLDNNLLPKYTK